MKTLVIEVLNCILLLSLANFAGASDAATQRQVATRTEPPKAAEQRAPEQPAKPLSSLKKTLPAIQYSLPLSFEPNRGQAPPDVELISHFGATALLLEKSAMTLHLCGKDDEISRSDIERIERGQHHGCNPLRNAVIHTSFVRASDSTQIEALDLLQGISNYFIGSDPKQWHTNIPVYARVRYRNIYPGIDLLFHGTEGQLEYDFVIAAG